MIRNDLEVVELKPGDEILVWVNSIEVPLRGFYLGNTDCMISWENEVKSVQAKSLKEVLKVEKVLRWKGPETV